MGQAPIRVILADDHDVICEGLCRIIAGLPHIEVVGTASSFADVRTLVRQVAGDVLTMDITGMAGSPLALVHRLTREQPQLGVVIYSSSIDYAPELIDAGVRGYVVKGEPVATLLQAIEMVAQGQRFVSPKVQEYLEQSAKDAVLSPKEVTVAKLLAQGMSTTQIASEMGIDARTVQNYITALRRKTGCAERIQIADWYRLIYSQREE